MPVAATGTPSLTLPARGREIVRLRYPIFAPNRLILRGLLPQR